jgi:hypothetical protein
MGQMSMAPGGLDVVRAHRMLLVERLVAQRGSPGPSATAQAAGATLPLEVQVITCGDAAIVGLPGEIFLELGLDLLRRSPFRFTLTLELANDACGYIPPRRAYDEGGYEVEAARFEAGTGEALVDAAVGLVGQLMQDA